VTFGDPDVSSELLVDVCSLNVLVGYALNGGKQFVGSVDVLSKFVAETGCFACKFEQRCHVDKSSQKINRDIISQTPLCI
jgi:hypothetical protein